MTRVTSLGKNINNEVKTFGFPRNLATTSTQFLHIGHFGSVLITIMYLRQLVHPITTIDGSSSLAVPPRSELNIDDKYDGNGVANLESFSKLSEFFVGNANSSVKSTFE
ncbi:hypothetical protein P8452_04011 [Trifolium repens]|nr:hypothetical protein P8452_04011 [Trifolium repens]